MPPSKRPRVSTLVPNDDLPPGPQVQKFITYYINHFDLKLAACQAKLMPEMGERLYKHPKVKALIDRKVMILDVEKAKLKARAETLTVSLLDASLAEEVKSKKNGGIRIRAIELGYKRTGLIRDGEFYVAPETTSNKNAPSIYQSRQITLRRTVTEEVTQTETAKLPKPPETNPIFAVREY